MKFTIFTPTYNRKELLRKLYESLKRQTYKDFEWLIVDDGSIDGTDEAVKQFQDEGELDIRYYYKENGGKQRAYNYGAERASGELFICIDSDDEYVEDGLERILKYWEIYEGKYKSSENRITALPYEDKDFENSCGNSLEKKGIQEEDSKVNKRKKWYNIKLAGMGYLSIYPDGKVIGTMFPSNEMIAVQPEIYGKYGVKGDKGLMFRTEVIREYPFPVFEGEKFITEAVVYNRICERYRMLYVNEKIEIKEYQDDGLTSSYNELLLSNPKGQALYHNEKNRFGMSLKEKILNNAVYYKFCKKAGYSFSKIFGESEAKAFLLLALPIGIYMSMKDDRRAGVADKP